eukprot:GHRQ01037129.1.p1 GENE.GHRQ01037129.1~~GHRQ01037129.1.p1  ORF type:complete len:122 (-),score=20.72 GHRQ01037129.1:237-602(-)
MPCLLSFTGFVGHQGLDVCCCNFLHLGFSLCGGLAVFLQMVKNTDLVVGDVYLVNMGDKVVADGIMIDGFHLVIDEASLTGEADVSSDCVVALLWQPASLEVAAGVGCSVARDAWCLPLCF